MVLSFSVGHEALWFALLPRIKGKPMLCVYIFMYVIELMYYPIL